MSVGIPGTAEFASVGVAVIGLGKPGTAHVQVLANMIRTVISARGANERTLEEAGDVGERGTATDPVTLTERALARKSDVVTPAPAVPEVDPLLE